jgi:hypothetical protein
VRGSLSFLAGFAEQVNNVLLSSGNSVPDERLHRHLLTEAVAGERQKRARAHPDLETGVRRGWCSRSWSILKEMFASTIDISGKNKRKEASSRYEERGVHTCLLTQIGESNAVCKPYHCMKQGGNSKRERKRLGDVGAR